MNFESMTGMPRGSAKKTRRGKRGRKTAPTSSHEHLANLTKAHGAGDHAATKAHAFALIKALPGAAKKLTPIAPAGPAPAQAPPEDQDHARRVRLAKLLGAKHHKKK